jgi:hypothetical protein
MRRNLFDEARAIAGEATMPTPRLGLTVEGVGFKAMLDRLDGIGPDAPTVTSPNGAKQSALPYRFDLMDARALFQLAAILHTGAEKYGVDNWRGLPRNDHVNHALMHIYAYLAGDTQDDHLGHAFCRLMMAVATEEA